jgi:hypothetical protein
LTKGLADKQAGVVAWSREANPQIGKCGKPNELFQAGSEPVASEQQSPTANVIQAQVRQNIG